MITTNVQLPYLQIKASLGEQKNPLKKPDGEQMKRRSLGGNSCTLYYKEDTTAVSNVILR